MRLGVVAMPDGRIFFDDMRVSMYAWSVAAQPDSAVTSGKPARLSADLMQNFFPSIARDGSRVAFTAFGGHPEGRRDLVPTAVAPTWQDIPKLAVIATILTILNYFLAKDIAEFDSVRDASGNPPAT